MGDPSRRCAALQRSPRRETGLESGDVPSSWAPVRHDAPVLDEHAVEGGHLGLSGAARGRGHGHRAHRDSRHRISRTRRPHQERCSEGVEQSPETREIDPVGADLGQPSSGKSISLEEGRPRSPPTGSSSSRGRPYLPAAEVTPIFQRPRSHSAEGEFREVSPRGKLTPEARSPSRAKARRRRRGLRSWAAWRR